MPTNHCFQTYEMAEEPSTKKKCRQYSVEYLKYGFVPSPHNPKLPFCLICEKSLSNEAMKPSRLVDHLKRNHPGKSDKDLEYFKGLRDRRKTLQGMFNSTSNQNDDGVKASYNIALMIAKTGKPHTIGETLIAPAIREVLKTVLHKNPEPVMRTLSLSNSTIQRRIDEMASNAEDELIQILRTTHFSIQLDESTLLNDEALLLAYVRFIHKEQVCQEMLFARSLKTDTKGQTVYQTVSDFCEAKEIPLTNIVACATDGAAAMVGRYRGFTAYLKEAVPNVLAVHCVIHRQHLVAKNLSENLHESLRIVIAAVNKIKANSLNSRLFKQLCAENDEDFDRLLLHTEVRWLSKGKCLSRLFNLFDSVVEFLHSINSPLADQLSSIKADVAYLADIFAMFNHLNLQLQGKDLNLIRAKSVISTFIQKLVLYRQSIGRRDFSKFPSLENINVELLDDKILVYSQHIESVVSDMKNRFQDLCALEVPSWILNPFDEELHNGSTLEEELLELLNDFELKPAFKRENYQEFWMQSEVQRKFPSLWGKAKLFFIAFPSSYLAEQGFSVVTQILTKSRNRLDIVKRGDLRLRLTSIAPNIDQLLQQHQIHPSH